jgi:hypothetical protein
VSKIVKTNACRILEEQGIAYTLRAYDVDEADLSAETVAAKVGLPAEQACAATRPARSSRCSRATKSST